jgi:hypothetical protein
VEERRASSDDSIWVRRRAVDDIKHLEVGEPANRSQLLSLFIRLKKGFCYGLRKVVNWLIKTH